MNICIISFVTFGIFVKIILIKSYFPIIIKCHEKDISDLVAQYDI